MSNENKVSIREKLASEFKHKPSDIHVKADNIVCTLYSMGYDIEDERDAIRIIETKNLDKSQFDYPYGSFDEFKKHVLAGEFDFDVEAMMMTDARKEQLRRDVEEGKLWITY